VGAPNVYLKPIPPIYRDPVADLWRLRFVERFTDCIGAKAKRDLSTLQPSDIAQFRDREAK
jgi:hypothetical protein